jgi:hypothetical protein
MRTIPGEAIAVDFDKSTRSFWTVSDRGLLLQWPIVAQILPNLSQAALGSSEYFDAWTATSQRGNSIAVALGGAKNVEVYIWNGNLGKFTGPSVVPFDVPAGLSRDEAADPRLVFGQISVLGFDPSGERLLLGWATKLNVIDISTSSVITSFVPDGGELIEDAVLGSSHLGVVYRSGMSQFVPLANASEDRGQLRGCELPKSSTLRGLSMEGDSVVLTRSNNVELWSTETCKVIASIKGAASSAMASLATLIVRRAESLRGDQGHIVACFSGKDVLITERAGLITIFGPYGPLLGPADGDAVAVSPDVRRAAFRSAGNAAVDIIDLHTGFKINVDGVDILGTAFSTAGAVHDNWGVMFSGNADKLLYLDPFRRSSGQLVIHALNVGPAQASVSRWLELIGTGATGLAVRDDGALYLPNGSQNTVEAFKRELAAAAANGDEVARFFFGAFGGR